MLKKTPSKKLNGLSFIAVILISICSIITVNYFTLKTLSGVRAFISGESHFTKAQLEACRHLELYIDSANPEEYKQFQSYLSIPIGDSLARVNMDKNGPDDQTLKFLIQGRNHVHDAKQIIFVYKNFKNQEAFKKSIRVWVQADQRIMELERLGEKIHQEVSNRQISPNERKVYAAMVNGKREQLVRLATQFESNLSDSIRSFNTYAIWTINIIALLAIIGIVYFFYRQIHLLSNLREKTQIQNQDLRQVNAEMDLFTYSVSHDLRSPITSMKGLVQLAQDENTNPNLSQYFKMMQMSLERQDLFIMNIINLTKHKRTDTHMSTIQLEGLIDSILVDIGYMVENTQINVFKELEVKTLFSDEFRLKIVLNNLLSNAFKYLDPAKPYLNISIQTKQVKDEVLIVIQDNGLGIQPEDQDKIFNMFYVVNHQSKGSGLGLYLVKETLNLIGGRIEVKSEAGFGTSFFIYLKCPATPSETT